MAFQLPMINSIRIYARANQIVDVIVGVVGILLASYLLEKFVFKTSK